MPATSQLILTKLRTLYIVVTNTLQQLHICNLQYTLHITRQMKWVTNLEAAKMACYTNNNVLPLHRTTLIERKLSYFGRKLLDLLPWDIQHLTGDAMKGMDVHAMNMFCSKQSLVIS